MIQPNELRIGNYVIDIEDGNVYQIPSGLSINSSNLMNPIPLTEEWIIKFGFEKIGYNFRKCEDHGCGLGMTEFVIWFNTIKKTYSIKAINILIEIQTVHSLQNIYFALVSKEIQQKID